MAKANAAGGDGEMRKVKGLMTDTEINIAVAEACGADEILASPQMGGSGYWPSSMLSALARLGLVVTNSTERPGKVVCAIPNYCGYLNAMATAEQTLTPTKAAKFRRLLSLNADGHKAKHHTVEAAMCHATARERAEAFLKTLGK
jgi:hypothetical protein